MTADLRYLPVWKKDATAAERLYECYTLASEKPERFRKCVVIYVEDVSDSSTLTRIASTGCSTFEVLGLLAEAQISQYNESRGG